MKIVKGLFVIIFITVLPCIAHSATFTSIADGNWVTGDAEDNSVWQNGTYPNYQNKLNHDILNINHHIFLNDNFDAKNGLTLNIADGAILEIYGNFEVDNNVSINIEGSGKLIIHGNFFALNNADVVIQGNVTVGGDMHFWNNGHIDLRGGSSLNVGGEICGKTGTGLTIQGDEESELTYESVCEDGYQIYNGSPLPIDLLFFLAEENRNRVDIHWVTATEINNDFFTLERSRNMQDWEILGYVYGAGTTSQVQQYSFSDTEPLSGLAYYRLKQTDFDGSFEYFSPVAVNFNPQSKELEFDVLKNGSSWRVAVNSHDPFVVEVYSVNGTRLYSASGINSVSFPNPGRAVVVRVINDSGTTAHSRVVM